MAAKKKVNEQYLKVPYHIFNIKNLKGGEKLLLAHIYSFGQEGCRQSNAALAEMFKTKPRTVSRWLTKLKKLDLVLCVNRKGFGRMIWAKSHPDVEAALSSANANLRILHILN